MEKSRRTLRTGLLAIGILAAVMLATAGSASAAFTQQATLTASGEIGNSLLGSAVALSRDGNLAVVGGPQDDNGVGAVWVFIRTHGKWTEQGKLTGEGEIGKGAFGTSVALSSDGKTALIGAPADNNGIGAASVFTRKGSNWTQQGEKLVGTDAGGSQEEAHCDRERGFEFCFVGHPADFGSSVALSSDGRTALVGGPGDNEQDGAAWVFARTGQHWVQQGEKLTGAGEQNLAEPHQTHFLVHLGGRFGASVALSSDGNEALIGGPTDDAVIEEGYPEELKPNGATWTFTRSHSKWTQQGEKLTCGCNLVSFFGTWFGSAVGLASDGTTALIGAPYPYGEEGERPATEGRVWEFARQGSTWTHQGEPLTAIEVHREEHFGVTLALSSVGNVALIASGKPERSSGAETAWVFNRSGSVWTRQSPPLACVGFESEERCGVALSGDASTALVGTAVYVSAPSHK